MTSWRDRASAQAQDDLDGILGPALEVAQQHLAQRGEFYPYAVAVDTSGDHEMIAADLPEVRPTSARVIAALTHALTARREQLRAIAIVTDTHVPELASDAIRASLEHREGVALAVLLPYSHRRFRGGIEYGQLQATTANTLRLVNSLR